MAREVLGVSVNRVNLVGAGYLDDLHELVEIAMVGEVEGRIGAEQSRELGILRPTGYQRGPVTAQASHLVLSRRRRDYNSTGRRVAVELDPRRQRTAGARIRLRARHAPALERELEAVGRKREHHLFGLAERVAEQHGRHAAIQGPPAPPGDGLDGRVRIAKPEMGPAVRALQDENMRSRNMRRGPPAWLSKLDVARVKEARAFVLEPQLCGAQHVAGRIQSQAGRPPAHRFAEPEHPPTARSPRLGDERQRLGREQRFFVAPGVIRMRVGDEGEGADHQWVEPEAVLRQRDAVVPNDAAGHSRNRSWAEKRVWGTSKPSSA